MGLWSSIKKIAKRVAKVTRRWVSAAVRWVLKAVFGLVWHVLNGIAEIVLFWKKKKLRLQVFILRDETGKPLTGPGRIDQAIQNAKTIWANEFNVELRFYGNPGVDTLPDPAPAAALDISCNAHAWFEEFGEGGAYFGSRLAGWVGVVPISLKFPVTIFFTRSFTDGKIGCSHRDTDYVVLDARDGVADSTTLAHELGHTCLLRHREDNQGNLMYPDSSRGTSTTWFQRRVVRLSRHCNFW